MKESNFTTYNTHSDNPDTFGWTTDSPDELELLPGDFDNGVDPHNRSGEDFCVVGGYLFTREAV